jgi:hypothetical protein
MRAHRRQGDVMGTDARQYADPIAYDLMSRAGDAPAAIAAGQARAIKSRHDHYSPAIACCIECNRLNSDSDVAAMMIGMGNFTDQG